MKATDFTEIFEKYSGQWVALADDEKTVLASSRSAKKTLAMAHQAGTDNPILFRVPKTSLAYVGGQG